VSGGRRAGRQGEKGCDKQEPQRRPQKRKENARSEPASENRRGRGGATTEKPICPVKKKEKQGGRVKKPVSEESEGASS